ncbi:hypothetical protein RBH29_08345 [Herbivorax sp. ANBcel31]|uniref:hypothetical protein n=1 Tax=Herbivorax sp. ANBcel31 TaxID=3069754 RepID=UPI0027AF9820|nr:hypothetical protein [Herbivorax sp. ANBcel31]MDQ2086438.1 hypothetical protein [Herbivorax sp. ANBcel31]
MKTVIVKFLICSIAGLLTGILIGCTVMSALISYRIDSYHEKIVSLENVIEESEIKYKKLKESLEELDKDKFIVKDILVYLIYDDIEEDTFDKIEFEKHIKTQYKNVLGKEVNSLDLELLVEVVDRDVFIIEKDQYRLRVDRILLSDVFKIWVTVKMI